MAIVFILLGCLGSTIFLCRYCLRIITVRGASMTPTLQAGDRVLAVRHWPSAWLHKNQIVLVQLEAGLPSAPKPPMAPETSDHPSLIIKRLIGLPHETVTLPRSALDGLSPSARFVTDEQTGAMLTWHIPAGHGFIKGDGVMSVDSVLHGPIPLRAISGVVVAKLPRRAKARDEDSPMPSEGEPFIAPSVRCPGERLETTPYHWSAADEAFATGALPAAPAYTTEQRPDNLSVFATDAAPEPLQERPLAAANGRSLKALAQTIVEILGLVWQAYPLACAGSLLITVLQGLLPLAAAWVTKVLFDWLALRLGGAGVGSGPVIWLLIAQGILTVGMAMLPLVNHYWQAELGRRLTVRIQTLVYQKINSFTGLAYFEDPQIYDSIRLAQQGAEFSSGQTLPFLMQLLQNLVTLLSFIGVLFAFQFTLASLVLLAALPQLVAQLKLGQQRFRLAFDVSRDERRKPYYAFLLASVEAAKEMRLFALGPYFLTKLLDLYRRVHQEQRRQEQREVRWELGLSLLASSVATVAFVLIVQAAFGGRLTLGDITLYVSALAAVQSALNGLLSAIAGLHESVLFHSYFQALQALPPALTVEATPRPVPPLTVGIELRHVSFRYHPEQPWVLRDINLKIPAGSCLALVGLNGAGKTTLVKLLTRLYDPTEGQILWDGIDIREFDPALFRQRLGALFQDFMRYDLTVRENIGLGNLDQINDLAQIQKAAQQANIHDELLHLPQGYETELSRMFAEEGQGFDLSGGQWQKVATARLFNRQADLLILDEPTAALDAEAEYELYQHFTALLAGRTSLLISHRFSTVRMATTIAVLAEGRISEYGAHDQLLRLNGAYARLYNMQAESYCLS
ncbi:MAG: ATP-binding cassette domain-containing protein [Caldilineaceae bacterium]